MPDRGATVEFRDVTKRYADQIAVDGLSFTVPAGKICILVGPSGSGKTTSLKMVNRLIEPTAGAILIDDHDILQEDPVQLRRRIGYVIQQVGLFPHQTIAENVATAAPSPCVASVADGRAVGACVVEGGPHAPAIATRASAMNAPILRASSTTGRP